MSRLSKLGVVVLILGTVFVWYEAFEKGRNDEMAAMFPDLAEFFTEVNAKTYDLMKIFADNIGQLIEPLNKALSYVQSMPKVQAGDFNTGHVIKTMLTGDSGNGMLQSGFETVLKKCVKSVTDTHEAVLKLARDYENIDDLNKVTGQQLSRAMGDVGSDITAVGSAGSKFGNGS